MKDDDHIKKDAKQWSIKYMLCIKQLKNELQNQIISI